MTSSGEDEEADVSRTPIIDVFIVYLHAFSRNLPSFTGHIVVVFCVLPVSISVAVFLVTAIFNFGVALIAQTVSSLVILVLLVPCLAMGLISAIATAYIIHFSQVVYLRLSTPSRPKSTFPPLMKFEKLEILEEKLKTL